MSTHQSLHIRTLLDRVSVLEIESDRLRNILAAQDYAIKTAGMDVAPCSVCGVMVLTVPEGGAWCKRCAEKEASRQ